PCGWSRWSWVRVPSATLRRPSRAPFGAGGGLFPAHSAAALRAAATTRDSSPEGFVAWTRSWPKANAYDSDFSHMCEVEPRGQRGGRDWDLRRMGRSRTP